MEGPNRRFFALPEINIGDSIAIVKRLLASKKGIPPDRQQLWAFDYPLEDNFIINDLEVNLLLTWLVDVEIRAISGTLLLTLQVGTTSTIFGLKELIAMELKIEPAQQRLVFDTRELNNGDYLSDYDVQSEAILTLVQSPQMT